MAPIRRPLVLPRSLAQFMVRVLVLTLTSLGAISAPGAVLPANAATAPTYTAGDIFPLGADADNGEANASIATASTGTSAIALWQTSDAQDIWVKYWDRTAWKTAQKIVSGIAGDPKVAMAPDGSSATVVWVADGVINAKSATVSGGNLVWGSNQTPFGAFNSQYNPTKPSLRYSGDSRRLVVAAVYTDVLTAHSPQLSGIWATGAAFSVAGVPTWDGTRKFVDGEGLLLKQGNQPNLAPAISVSNTGASVLITWSGQGITITPGGGFATRTYPTGLQSSFSRNSGSTWSVPTDVFSSNGDTSNTLASCLSSDGTKAVIVGNGISTAGVLSRAATITPDAVTWESTKSISAGSTNRYTSSATLSSMAATSDCSKLIVTWRRPGPSGTNYGSVSLSRDTGATWLGLDASGYVESAYNLGEVLSLGTYPAWTSVSIKDGDTATAIVTYAVSGGAKAKSLLIDSSSITWGSEISFGETSARSISAVMASGGDLVHVIWSAPIPTTSNHGYTAILRLALPPNAPNTPTVARAGSGAIKVTWTDSVTGGTPKTYTVSVYDGATLQTGKTCSISTPFPDPLTCTVSGLTDGTIYTFKVTASNDAGDSDPSAASNELAPAPAPSVTSISPTVGTVDGGTEVTITGTNFVEGATVKIGGATCTSVVWVSATQVKCTTPAKTAGTYDVVVTNLDGQTGTKAGAYTYAAAPSAPQTVTAIPGNTQAAVTWTAPTSDGGAAITKYVVTSNDGKTCEVTRTLPNAFPDPLTCTITGLTNGTPYTFTVKATNAIGDSPASGASDPVTPATTVPGPPTSVVATAGNAKATITFSPPATDGGAPITKYTVTSGDKSCVVETPFPDPLACTIEGLTNGTPYTFTVKAENSNGQGSGATASTTPRAPDAVSALTNLVPSQGSMTFDPATLTYTINVANGISSMTLTPTFIGLDQTATLSLNGGTAVDIFSGMASGALALNVGTNTITIVSTSGDGTTTKTYTITVVRAAAVPSVPRTVTASAGNGRATVTWTAPISDGGSQITRYTVTSSGGQTCVIERPFPSPLSCAVTGLTNDTAYTFTVVATNDVGNSDASGASTAVTPRAPAPAPTDPPVVVPPTPTPPPVEPTPVPAPVTVTGPTGTPAPIALPSVSGASNTAPSAPSAQPVALTSTSDIVVLALPREQIVMAPVVLPATTATSGSQQGIRVTGDQWSMAITSSTQFQRGSSTDASRIQIEVGNTVTTFGTGFKPNSQVDVYVHSTPQWLGSVITDANGNYVVTLPMPQTLQAGEHVFQALGITKDGVNRHVNVPIQLVPVASTQQVKSFDVFFGMNSIALSATAKKQLASAYKSVTSALAPSSVVNIRIVGWVQPTKVSPRISYLSTGRATAVMKYLKQLGLRGTYELRTPGHDKVNSASSRRASVTITWTARN